MCTRTELNRKIIYYNKMNDGDRIRITTQLAEIELLMSMFPNSGEVKFDDASELADLRAASESDGANMNCVSGVGFTLHLVSVQHEVQVLCRLPFSYPQSPPVISIRSAALNSTQQHRLNSSLQEFISVQTRDCPSCGFLNEIIQWITDNFPHYTSKLNDVLHQTRNVALQEAQDATNHNFSRLWIYSHHIYNREKRRTVINNARELDLTGFSAPGKPGIICVEGSKSNCDSFWQRIRSLQWQRITLSHREDLVSSSSSSSSLSSLRRFESFDEKCFVNPNKTSSHGTHLDRGQLLHFLQQNGCKDVFRFLFGIDGKEEPCVETAIHRQ